MAKKKKFNLETEEASPAQDSKSSKSGAINSEDFKRTDVEKLMREEMTSDLPQDAPQAKEAPAKSVSRAERKAKAAEEKKAAEALKANTDAAAGKKDSKAEKSEKSAASKKDTAKPKEAKKELSKAESLKEEPSKTESAKKEPSKTEGTKKDSLKPAESSEKPQAQEENPPAKKKLSAFSRGLIIYTGALVAVALVCLIVLYSFLTAYEHSRPLNCVKDYLSDAASGNLPESCLAALKPQDENLQTADESAAFFLDILPDVKYGKYSELSSPENPAYVLSYEDKPLGLIYLSALDKHPFGLTFWKVERDEYDFSAFTNSHSLLIPSDYSVSVNGRELGKEYVTAKDIKYQSLSSFYESYPDLPTLVRYESGSYIGPESLEVRDAAGNIVPNDKLSQADFLSNCSEETLTAVKQFTDEFVRRYVTYAANLGGTYYMNYINARNLTVPDSILFNRLGQAIGSFGYTVIYSCDIIENNINACYQQGERFFVDLTYITETVSRGDPTQERNNMRLVVVPSENGYLAEAMFTY